MSQSNNEIRKNLSTIQQNKLSPTQIAQIVDTKIRPFQKPTYYLTGPEDLRITLPHLPLKANNDEVLIFSNSLAIYLRILPDNKILCFIGDPKGRYWLNYTTRNIINLLCHYFNDRIAILLSNTELQYRESSIDGTVIALEMLLAIAENSENFITQLQQCQQQPLSTHFKEQPPQVRLLKQGLLPKQLVEHIKQTFQCPRFKVKNAQEINLPVSTDFSLSALPEQNIAQKTQSYSKETETLYEPKQYHRVQFFDTHPELLTNDNCIYANNLTFQFEVNGKVKLIYQFKDKYEFLFSNFMLSDDDKKSFDEKLAQLNTIFSDISFDRQSLTFTISAASLTELHTKLDKLLSDQQKTELFHRNIQQQAAITRFIAEAKELINIQKIKSRTVTGGLAFDQVNRALRKFLSANSDIFVLTEHFNFATQALIPGIISKLPNSYQTIIFSFGLLDKISIDNHQVAIIIDQKQKMIKVIDSAGNYNFPVIQQAFAQLIGYKCELIEPCAKLTDRWSCGVHVVLNILHQLKMLDIKTVDLKNLDPFVRKILRAAEEDGNNSFEITQKSFINQQVAAALLKVVSSAPDVNHYSLLIDILNNYLSSTEWHISLMSIVEQFKSLAKKPLQKSAALPLSEMAITRQIKLLETIIFINELLYFTNEQQIEKIVNNIFSNLPSEDEFISASKKKHAKANSTYSEQIEGYFGSQIELSLKEGQHYHYLFGRMLEEITSSDDWQKLLFSNINKGNFTAITNEIFSLIYLFNQYRSHLSTKYLVFQLIHLLSSNLVNFQQAANIKQLALAAERKNIESYETAMNKYFHEQFELRLRADVNIPSFDMAKHGTIIKTISERGRQAAFQFEAKQWKELLHHFTLDEKWLNKIVFERVLSLRSSEPLWIILLRAIELSNKLHAEDFVKLNIHHILNTLSNDVVDLKIYVILLPYKHLILADTQTATPMTLVILKRLIALYFDENSTSDEIQQIIKFISRHRNLTKEFKDFLDILSVVPQIARHRVFTFLSSAYVELIALKVTNISQLLDLLKLFNSEERLLLARKYCNLLHGKSTLDNILNLLDPAEQQSFILDLARTKRETPEQFILPNPNIFHSQPLFCLELALKLLKIKPDAVPEFLKFYIKTIVPALHGILRNELSIIFSENINLLVDEILSHEDLLINANLANFALILKIFNNKKNITKVESDKIQQFLEAISLLIRTENNLLSILTVIPKESCYLFYLRYPHINLSIQAAISICELLPEDKKLEFINKHRTKITLFEEFNCLISLLPINCRAIFALEYLHLVKTTTDFVKMCNHLEPSVVTELMVGLCSCVRDVDMAHNLLLAYCKYCLSNRTKHEIQPIQLAVTIIFQLIPDDLKIKMAKKLAKSFINYLFNQKNMYSNYDSIDMDSSQACTYLNTLCKLLPDIQSINSYLSSKKEAANSYSLYAMIIIQLLQPYAIEVNKIYNDKYRLFSSTQNINNTGRNNRLEQTCSELARVLRPKGDPETIFNGDMLIKALSELPFAHTKNKSKEAVTTIEQFLSNKLIDKYQSKDIDIIKLMNKQNMSNINSLFYWNDNLYLKNIDISRIEKEIKNPYFNNKRR